MNEEVLYNKYYENFTDFRDAVLGFLEGLADPPVEVAERLLKRITDSFRAFGKTPIREEFNAI